MGCLFVFYKATNILFFIKIFFYYLIFLTKKLIKIYFNNKNKAISDQISTQITPI